MRKTFIFSCVLMILLVMLTLGYAVVSIRRTLAGNANSYLHMTHDQILQNIENYMTEVESIALSMCYSPSVQQYLGEMKPAARVPLFADVQAVYANLSYMNHAIEAFSIYDRSGHFLSANGSDHSVIALRDSIDIQPTYQYHSIYAPNRYIGISKPSYVLTIPVYPSRTAGAQARPIGAIAFTISLQYIQNQLQSAGDYQGGFITLRDDALGTAIASAGANDPPQASHSVITKESVLSPSGWRLVTNFRSGVISEDMQPIWRMILLVGVLIIGMLLFFLSIVSRQILLPIQSMSRFMQGITLNPGPQEYAGRPNMYRELAAMATSMNLMLRSLDQKSQALLTQEKRALEAELAADRLEIMAYRSQINPHFLYNTLDCISGMAFRYNAPEIDEITQALSGMFRYAIKGPNIVHVSEELVHMREYATIVRHRFMGRIAIDFHVTDGALSVRIPRLVLQPVLENAVFHGAEKRVGPARVDVRIQVEGSALHMTVRDNGIGMDAAQLQAVQNRIANAQGNQPEAPGDAAGIGLWNIVHRLRLFYQGKSALTFESTQGEGTTVRIVLPLGQEGEDHV